MRRRRGRRMQSTARSRSRTRGHGVATTVDARLTNASRLTASHTAASQLWYCQRRRG